MISDLYSTRTQVQVSCDGSDAIHYKFTSTTQGLKEYCFLLKSMLRKEKSSLYIEIKNHMNLNLLDRMC